MCRVRSKREICEINLCRLPFWQDAEIINLDGDRNRDTLNNGIVLAYITTTVSLGLLLPWQPLVYRRGSFIASSLRFLSGLSSMILRLLFIKNSRWSDFLMMLAFLMPKRLPTRLSGVEGSSDDSLITAPTKESRQRKERIGFIFFFLCKAPLDFALCHRCQAIKSFDKLAKQRLHSNSDYMIF